jgi:hypothetical protein
LGDEASFWDVVSFRDRWFRTTRIMTAQIIAKQTIPITANTNRARFEFLLFIRSSFSFIEGSRAGVEAASLRCNAWSCGKSRYPRICAEGTCERLLFTGSTALILVILTRFGGGVPNPRGVEVTVLVSFNADAAVISPSAIVDEEVLLVFSPRTVTKEQASGETPFSEEAVSSSARDFSMSP